MPFSGALNFSYQLPYPIKVLIERLNLLKITAKWFIIFERPIKIPPLNVGKDLLSVNNHRFSIALIFNENINRKNVIVLCSCFSYIICLHYYVHMERVLLYHVISYCCIKSYYIIQFIELDEKFENEQQRRQVRKKLAEIWTKFLVGLRQWFSRRPDDSHFYWFLIRFDGLRVPTPII